MTTVDAGVRGHIESLDIVNVKFDLGHPDINGRYGVLVRNREIHDIVRECFLDAGRRDPLAILKAHGFCK